MDARSFFRRLYSLDTLDTRFTTSSRTPLKATNANTQPTTVGDKDTSVDDVSSSRGRSVQHEATPSRWRTPEFYFYYVVFIVVVPQMFKAVYDVSQVSHPNYPKYAGLLSPGLIRGRKVDNSDDQYASFRDNIPYMAIVIILHPTLRRIYNRFFPPCGGQPQSNSGSTTADGHMKALSTSVTADIRLEQRVSYDFFFALLFLLVLHGFSAVKVLIILYANYKIVTCLPKRYVPAATWLFNIGILFANELCHGYPFASIAEMVATWEGSADAGASSAIMWGKWLDAHGGLMSRWDILFNLTVLRLISYNFDYYWSLDTHAGSPIEVFAPQAPAMQSNAPKKKQLDLASLSERDRVTISARSSDFTFRNYLAYVLYSPLYLTGPILTFNDYISQQRWPSPSITSSRTALYGFRFLLSLTCMELLLHYCYAVAICKASPDWSAYTPFQVSMLAFFNLHIIWLKLLLPWRFFRFWALVDGIDPPENVVRCMSDNYSALAFWRGWHRSYNRWLVRYIYVPLGGSGRGMSKARSALNFLAVFTFVALWHDINLRLLMWGWLISLFVLPEVVATLLFPRKKWEDRPNTYRVLCGIGAVGNILMMMVANLVGFAVGVDGLKGLIEGIAGSYSGVVFMAAACAALFVGVQVMFEIRESEVRQGIKMKC